MYVSTEALGVGVPTGFYFDLCYFLSFGEGFVIRASWEGLISAFLSFFFIRIYVYYMFLSDSCVTCTYPASL